MKLSAIRINSAMREQGQWIDNIPDLGGVKLKVRGVDNTDARRLRAKLVAEMPPTDKPRNVLTDEAAERLTVAILSESILMGWQGLENEDGTPIVFSIPQAAEILANPDFALFRNGVNFAANIIGTEAATAAADTAKN